MRIQVLREGRMDATGASPPLPLLDRLCTRQKLDAVLHRERSRADRTGQPLALVIFALREQNQPTLALERLALALGQRARITDDIGWYTDTACAAVLPDTPASGAWKFASDVLAGLVDPWVSVKVSVHTYPSQHHEPPRPPSPRHDATGRLMERRGAGTPPHHAARENIAGAAEALDPLLVHPIPRWKRAIDILGAVMVLLLALPVFLIAALAVKLSSCGPVLFVQWRSGRGGKPFRMYKFRTMRADAEAQRQQLQQHSEQDGPAFKMRNDPRITRVGRLLRVTSIDELPQLLNVLRGEMSLVGPRPLPCHEAQACCSWHQRRHDVLPGLTCIWQVRGRSRVSFEEWMRMDVEYIRNLCLLQDLRILLQTIPAVLLHRGAC